MASGGGGSSAQPFSGLHRYLGGDIQGALPERTFNSPGIQSNPIDLSNIGLGSSFNLGPQYPTGSQYPVEQTFEPTFDVSQAFAPPPQPQMPPMQMWKIPQFDPMDESGVPAPSGYTYITMPAGVTPTRHNNSQVQYSMVHKPELYNGG